MTDKEQAVYDYVKKHKPERQRDIVEALELNPGVVHNALKVLQALGKVDYRPARYTAR